MAESDKDPIERDVMEYDVVIVGGRPLRSRLRHSAQATEARPQRLPAGEGGIGRRARALGLRPRARTARRAAAGVADRVRRHQGARDARRVRAAYYDEALPAADAAADVEPRQLHRLARQSHVVARRQGRSARLRRVRRLRRRGAALRRGRRGLRCAHRRHGPREGRRRRDRISHRDRRSAQRPRSSRKAAEAASRRS